MLFRLPIIKFFNRILNRITVTVVLVALQLAWLAWVFFALTTGTARVWVTGVLNGLSLLIILYLVRKDENSAYKVGWIALIGDAAAAGRGAVSGLWQQAPFPSPAQQNAGGGAGTPHRPRPAARADCRAVR